MNLYEKLNRLDDSLSERVSYSYLVYAESGSTDEEGLFDDIRLAKELAKKIAIELSEKDPGAYVLIKRGIRGSDVVNDTWKVINRVKYDPEKNSFEFNTPQTPHPLYGMIDENLNEINNSLIESKRIVKKKKLTESVEDDFDYAEFIPEEMTQFFCINEEDNEDLNEYMPEKGYRGYKAVASLIACGEHADELRDCGYKYALLINDPADNFFVGYVAGDRIHKLTEEDIYDQISVDYDDDIDEMLTEDVKGPGYYIRAWESPERVKNSNPSIDTLKKGKLYPEFEDVLAALKTSEFEGLGAYEIVWVQSK